MSTHLVIGGTGKVGRRLVDVLRQRGETVIAASRTRGDVRFDWHEQATYTPAVASVETVFIIGPGSASDWSDLASALLEKAARSGVKHAMLLSARGVEFLPDGVVAKAEQAVEQGPVAWTILRPTHFAQNFTEAMWTPVDGEILAPVGNGAEPFIDAQDIAEVGAEILANRTHARETIAVSGPEALTFEQAASVLTANANAPVRYVSEDPDAHPARLRAEGTPETYITWWMAMLDGIRRGADAYISSGVDDVLGRPATDFATWARRELASGKLRRA